MNCNQKSEKALRSMVHGALMLLAVVLTTAVSAGAQAAEDTNPLVVLKTGLGRIVIEVYEDRAPKNAAYFLEFVGKGEYDEGSFYRAGASVAADAHPSPIIQGGFLFDAATGEFSLEHDGARVKTLPTFDTTEESGIKHVHGTVSLARDVCVVRPVTQKVPDC